MKKIEWKTHFYMRYSNKINWKKNSRDSRCENSPFLMWLRFSILNEDDDDSNLHFISKQIFWSLLNGKENLKRENNEASQKTNLHKL